MRRQRGRFQRVLRVHQRKVGHWLNRHAGELDRQVPSWGGSLLFHALILVMLGIYLYVSTRQGGDKIIQGRFPRLGDEVTSLVDSDHAGDPFTRIKSDEPPSLSLEKAAPDETKVNQPEIPGLLKFGPELSSPEFVPERNPLLLAEGPKSKNVLKLFNPNSPRGLATVISGLHSEDLTAPFSGRGDPTMKAKLLRREGGTVRSEKAVEDGLAWIIRHQRQDGGWSLNFHSQCNGPGGCPPHEVAESEAAATGLALLPLLGAGHIHTEKSRYQPNIRMALEWLVQHQQPDGDLYIGQGGQSQLYSHAIATMALCEAYGLSKDPKLREAAQRAIDFIAESQNPNDGGWRYRPGQAGDTSVFGWQMFALRSAKISGLKVPPSVIKGCRAYLDAATSDSSKVTYAYMPGLPPTPVMTAEALLSRQYLGWPRNFPPLVKGASRIAEHLLESQERNIYYWYYATQLLHNMQNKDWERWNVRVREGLIAMQITGTGCDKGSWDPFNPQPDRWARSGGRLFLTSLSILSLEVYYRYLPLYNVADTDAAKLMDGEKNKQEAKP